MVAADSEQVIRVEGLTKRYPRVTALDSVSFAVARGTVGLLGANGAGKSTLIKILLGLLPADSGTARVLGHDVSEDGLAARRWIGYMPEHDCLPDDQNAFEFVAQMGQLSGLPPRESYSRAADTLRYVGLDEARYRAMGGYSTGMKQRAKLACALVHDPRLLLLDEPTNGLDPAGREQMLDLIRKTGQTQGMAIVITTHLLADVEKTCDHVLVLDGGRLLRSGPLSSFHTQQPVLRIDAGRAAAQLAAALVARGADATTEGDQVRVSIQQWETYDHIRDAAVETGAPLIKMTPVSSTLADVFVQME